MTGQGADKATQEATHSGQHDGNINKKTKQWRNNKNGPVTKNQSSKGAFKGAIAALNGNVYEVHNEAFKANQFQKTTKAIAAYVNRTMKHGNDMRFIIENLTDVNFDALIPTEPKTGNVKVDEMMLQQAVSLFMKRKDQYEANKNALYTIIWEQCSEALQAKLEGTPQYEDYAPISCPIGLLKHIKQASLQFENVTYTAAAVDDAKLALYSFYQTKQDTLHQYYLKFKDLCDALEHYGAEVGYDISLVRDIAKRNGDKDTDDINVVHPSYELYKSAARERYLAFRFLRGADRSKYGDFVTDLENDYSKGGDYYPNTVAAAYTLLKRYKKGTNSNKQTRPGNPDGNKDKSGTENDIHAMVFVNKDGKTVGKDVVCYDCGGNHYRGDANCPRKSKITEDDDYSCVSSSVKVAFVGAQPEHIINRPWILLDNQSSVHIFNHANLVENITTVPVKNGLLIHSNGGSQFTNKIATHPDVGEVWFNPNAITNIFSFSQCRRDGMNLSYDYDADVFTLTTPSTGTTYVFSHVDEGLYACDYSVASNIRYCAATVEQLSRSYTPRQIAAADKARSLYRLLGRPSDRVFKHMLSHNLIRNTDVTVEDVNRANTLYGPELGALKGKTVRSMPSPVRIPAAIPLPNDIRDRHRQVTLCLDVCHVDGLRFLASISRHLHFATAEFVSSLDHDTIVASIRRLNDLYSNRGFVVEWLLTDRAFEHIRPVTDSLNIRLNVTAANEHVPEIERFIRVIKERVRGFLTTYSVTHLPNIMKIHLIQHLVQMLNLTIQPNGVSDIYSPATIVIGTQLDVDVHCRLEFGTYCQVHDDTDPRNSVHAPRTIDAISLRPLGNLQGGYYFLCLTSWRVIARRTWTVLPMPQHVIDLLITKSRTETLQRPQYLRRDNFHFRRSDRSTITSFADDDNHLLLYPFVDEGAPVPANDDNPTTGFTNDEHPTDPIHDAVRLDTDDDVSSDDDDNGDDDNAGSVDDDSVTDHIADDDSNADDSNADDDGSSGDDDDDDDDNLSHDDTDNNDNSGNNDDDDDTNLLGTEERGKLECGELLTTNDHNNEPDLQESGELLIDDAPLNSLEAVINRTNPITVLNRDPSVKNTINPEVIASNILPPAPDHRPSTRTYSMRQPVVPSYAKGGFNLAIACTQMTAKEGLKRFGQLAEDALLIEWKQLDNLKVYNGVYYDQLTPEHRARVLRLVQLIKLKRCGKLKGRTCADGRKQRGYIPADDTTSPTVSTEALLMSLMIDAKERRKVVTADVPGAFLHAKMDDVVHVVVEGEQLRILLKSNPTYAMYVHTDPKTNKDKLYLKLNKALYGTLKAARLFFDDLTKNLKDMGFTPNPYDPCVMNKNIKGSQCTIAWHVDDIKISHKRQDVIEDVLKKLEEVYGELSITRGTKHTFVGMDIEFKRNKVEISMKSYLKEALEAFPEDTSRSVTSPAANHLYTVNPNAKRLPEHLRECFHHIVAKLLFVATRGRPDFQPTISFLTSRCAKADEDDWKKLKRLLCYIRGTLDLKLILRANAMNIVMWWADAAFAVRDDFKSQSGRGMSLGGGMIQCKSNKQATTENSSTTAELISSSDALIMIIWTSNFLKAQGYPIRDTILFQDNMSAIKLERNGRQSSSKRTRHVDIRHFFIKDRVQTGELNVKHCGTEDMIADYFTKPLQGAKFIKFRDLILGITDIDSTDQIRSVLEEDLKWPNLKKQISDDKRPYNESPEVEENYERRRKVTFSDSS